MLIYGFYVFISLFAIAAIVHLFFCFKESEKFRCITKTPCLVLLGISIIFLAPHHPLIYCSCFMAAIGDFLLLMQKKFKFLLIGTAFFAIGHILYTIEFVNILSKYIDIAIYAYPIAAVIILATGIVGYCVKKDIGKIVAFGGPIYISLILLNAVLTILILIYGQFGMLSAFMLTGYLIFLFSDFMVAKQVLEKGWKKDHFYIMLTYLLAECAISISLAYYLILI